MIYSCKRFSFISQRNFDEISNLQDILKKMEAEGKQGTTRYQKLKQNLEGRMTIDNSNKPRNIATPPPSNPKPAAATPPPSNPKPAAANVRAANLPSTQLANPVGMVQNTSGKIKNTSLSFKERPGGGGAGILGKIKNWKVTNPKMWKGAKIGGGIAAGGAIIGTTAHLLNRSRNGQTNQQ